MEAEAGNSDGSSTSNRSVLRKEVVKSMMHFIKAELDCDSLDSEQKESLAVAKQCLEVCYEIDTDKVEKPVDLIKVFELLNLCEHTEKNEAGSNGGDAEVYKLNGNECMRDGDFKGAVEYYTRAININNKKAIYYCNRAAALSRLNRHKDAIVDCKEAIKLDPNYGKAYGRLGIAYSNLMMYPQAAEAYRTALRLDPNNTAYEDNLRLAEEKMSQNAAPPGMNFDFSGFMNNPALLSMASQMLNDPTFRNMVSGIMTSGPGSDPNLDTFVEVGQQLAEHMHSNNPDVLEQLRQHFVDNRQVRDDQQGGNPGPTAPPKEGEKSD